MAYGKPHVPFTPVILFDTKQATPADQLAIDMVYSLYRDIQDTMKTERNAQQEIGLSEFGMECDKCVARMMSGLYAKIPENDTGWKAQVGTFGHAGLEDHFAQKYRNASSPMFFSDYDEHPPKPTDEHPNYHLERNLVLTGGGISVPGHCDLYLEGATFGLVTDWKFQGPSKLKKTGAAQIGQQYETQMSGYGLAWQQLGKLVTHVVLYALPRDGDLNEARPVLARFDPQPAIRALARMQKFKEAAETLEAAFPGEGWDRLIRAQQSSTVPWDDCRSYERAERDDLFAGFEQGR
jgi:hypothetical protein